MLQRALLRFNWGRGGTMATMEKRKTKGRVPCCGKL
jgi:hypothetical protein